MPRLGPFPLRHSILVSGTSYDIAAIIKAIPTLNERFKLVEKNLYEVSPLKTERSYFDVLRNNATAGNAIDGHSDPKRIVDFEDSENFYTFPEAESKRRKDKDKKAPKIISDSYSVARAEVLFIAFGELETRLRRYVLKNKKVSEASAGFQPLSFRSAGIDHRLSYATLFEIITNIFLLPCSKEFYLERLRQSETTDEATLVKIRDLKMVDELGLPISSDDLEKLGSLRNACMHFRVIRHSEFMFGMETINKYISDEMLGETTRTLKTAQEEITKQFQKLAEQLTSVPIASLYNVVRDLRTPLDKIRTDLKP